jgi:hypothetical protein
MSDSERSSVDRRGFLKGVAAGAAAAATPAAMQEQEHDHQDVPSDLTLRVKALESLLVEKGLVDPAALDALVDTMEHKVGPRATGHGSSRAPGWIPRTRSACSRTSPRRSPSSATPAG